jgi:ATP-binding cassette subfamily B protein
VSDGTGAPLLRLWRRSAAHRRRALVAGLCSFTNKVFDLAPPVLIGAAVDVVVERNDSLLARLGAPSLEAQLLWLAVLTFIVWAAESLFEYLYAVLWRNLAQDVQHELRDEAYAKVQSLESAVIGQRTVGDLMAVLNDDVNQLERFLDKGANNLIQVATTVTCVGAAFFWISPLVALLSFVPVPLILIGSFTFQKRIGPRYAAVRHEVGRLNAALENRLAGRLTIQSFTAEDRERAHVRALSQRYREVNARAIRLSSAFSPLIRIVVLIGFVATLLVGGHLALSGELAVGSYSVLVFLTQRLLWPLTRLGETFDLYQRAMASLARILDVTDLEPELASGTAALDDHAPAAVTFDDVRFGYAPGATLFDGLHLEVAAGSTTAVVGATGSGKSTLIKLLLRFYDPDGGCVRLGDVDVRDLTLKALREHIALVSQDVFLFDGTVRENIAYGHPDATFAQVKAAADAAEATGFIEALEQGFDSPVGEKGQNLSGGQRQRLCIARAVLKDAPLLVLDEATSAVDNETEAAIQRSLMRLGEGRTVIIIAHRLSTIRHADRIYVLDRGEVAQVGTHDALVAQDGIYARLWHVQTGEADVSAAA